MRKMKAVLSTKSLRQLSNEFNTYVNTLDLKCERLIERLTAEGIKVVDQNMASFKGDSSRSYTTYVSIHRVPNKSVSATLVVENEDILFIEFGAGIYYNNGNAHPQASELGYGVGTYPDQRNAINPGYWWYKDDDGNGLHFSLGTEATMPVYKAYKAMAAQVIEIAKEVFANG
jgi:hypothetical protein